MTSIYKFRVGIVTNGLLTVPADVYVLLLRVATDADVCIEDEELYIDVTICEIKAVQLQVLKQGEIE